MPKRSTLARSSDGGLGRNRPHHGIDWGRLLRRLERFYSNGQWRVPVLRERGADPYLVLISTILSHRTRDEVTRRATVRVLTRYPSPSALARARPATVFKLVREAGLAAQKAAALVSGAKTIAREFGGHVPDSEADLRSLPRVGPKTARAILVFGFQRQAIPVDAHIHRVVNRLGVIRACSPSETSDALRREVPREYWAVMNPVLVQHGQNLCSALNPRCGECPIQSTCLRVGVA